MELELRREQWWDDSAMLGSAVDQRLVRLIERGRPNQRSNDRPLQHRHGLGDKRHRPMGLELRGIEWWLHGRLLSSAQNQWCVRQCERHGCDQRTDN